MEHIFNQYSTIFIAAVLMLVAVVFIFNRKPRWQASLK